MTPLRFLFVIGLAIMTCCGVEFGALPTALFYHALGAPAAMVLGDHIRLRVFPAAHGGIWAAPMVADAGQASINLGGEVDSLVLRDLKLTYRIGAGPSGATSLGFLERLPAIRRLDLQNAELLLVFEGKRQQVKLSDLNLTVKDFASMTGGSIAFQANFTATEEGETAFAVAGRVRGDLELTGIHPKPYGKGTIECVVESARYARGERTFALGRFALTADLAYDRKTDTISIRALRGESQDFGTITGEATASLRNDVPWSASVSAASIDLSRAFRVVQPSLPDGYRAWAVEGQGAVKLTAQGTFGGDRPSLDGAIAIAFTRGGFATPDGTKAAQGVDGGLNLTLAYGSQERKITFTVQAEQRDGEYLWGTYYANLAGRRASLTMDGTYDVDGSQQFALSGSMDVFQTGEYAVNGGGHGGSWTIQLTAAEVSHARVVDTLLREYFKGLSPGSATLSVTGTSSLEATIRHDGDALAIAGTYGTKGASLAAPDTSLSIQGVTAHVPFALRYPPLRSPAPSAPLPGFVRLEGIQRRRLAVERLQIPLVVFENALEVPEPLVVPFFGGEVHLFGLQIDDVLFPARYRFGLKITDLDLGRLTRRVAGVEVPGRLDADLGMMRYENNRIASEGRALVTVFGGEIEATDLFVDNPASPSRKFGANLTFRNISLEELTRQIPVGKMTGVIQGSLRDFTMEYGEAASFVLAVESVRTRGVPQSISVDAIQNISILGTGADSALNRGVTQLFKEYPYSKIGLRLALKNDQFSVNGTIHEGGKEYLVRRGLVRGVDVVNQNPDNVISFRDMTERIKRLSRPPEIAPGGIKVE